MNFINRKHIISLSFVLLFLQSVITLNVLAQGTGYLKFDLNVDTAYTLIDTNEPIKIANGDSVKLQAWRHRIVLSVPFDYEATYSIVVDSNKTKTLTHNFTKREISGELLDGNIAAKQTFDADFMIVTDHDTEIYFDGEYIGKEFASVSSESKVGTIEFRNPEFGKKSIDTEANNYRLKFYGEYRRPEQGLSKALSFFPGASQFYKRQYFKSVLFVLGSTYLFNRTVQTNNSYHSNTEQFNELKRAYDNALDEQTALMLGNQIERLQDTIVKNDNQRRAFFGITLLLYAANIYDAFTSKPNGGFQKKKPLDFYLSGESVGNFSFATGTVRYSF